MRKIDVAADMEFFGRIDSNAAIAFGDLERLQNLQIAALAAETAKTGLLEHGHEGFGGTIKNGDFDGVDVDVNVVDSAGINSGEQVLCGRQQNALLHQAGGVADARDVFTLRFNGKIVQVDA